MVDAGRDVVDVLVGDAEVLRQLERGALHAVTQADGADALAREIARQLIAIGFV